jgi:hypothetical protein
MVERPHHERLTPSVSSRAEREAVAAAHSEQFRAFMAQWEAYLDSYDAGGREQLEAMKARHLVQVRRGRGRVGVREVGERGAAEEVAPQR